MTFDITMERLERMIMFHFSLSGEVRTLCDRCLGELTIPVNGEEHLCVRFSDTETCDDEDVVVVKTPPVRVHSVILKITGTIEQLNAVKAAMEKAGVTFRKVEF